MTILWCIIIIIPISLQTDSDCHHSSNWSLRKPDQQDQPASSAGLIIIVLSLLLLSFVCTWSDVVKLFLTTEINLSSCTLVVSVICCWAACWLLIWLLLKSLTALFGYLILMMVCFNCTNIILKVTFKLHLMHLTLWVKLMYYICFICPGIRRDQASQSHGTSFHSFWTSENDQLCTEMTVILKQLMHFFI